MVELRDEWCASGLCAHNRDARDASTSKTASANSRRPRSLIENDSRRGVRNGTIDAGCEGVLRDGEPQSAFEGRFVTAVATTRVYYGRAARRRFQAAERRVLRARGRAEKRAFGRAPLRRPELSPKLRVARHPRTVTRAVRLIAEGRSTARQHRASRHAARSQRRHLRRSLQKLGASPIAVAQTRRLHLARRLLDETALPITTSPTAPASRASAASTTAFRQTFALSPSEARASQGRQTIGDAGPSPAPRQRRPVRLPSLHRTTGIR